MNRLSSVFRRRELARQSVELELVQLLRGRTRSLSDVLAEVAELARSAEQRAGGRETSTWPP